MNKKIRDAIIWICIIGALAWTLWWMYDQLPKGEDYSKDYPIVGQTHVAVGASHDPYNSNPPTSGPHYAEPADEGFYGAPIPDERVVHNLEHGDVWIAYRPNLPDNVKDMLRDIAKKYDKVIITPRDANDFDISVVAWGRLDSFNLDNGILDRERAENFIKRYVNNGPEKVPASLHRQE